MGVVAYADDLVLLAPTRNAAEKMLNVCENFAEENNMRFSTHSDPIKSKSKAMLVSGPKHQSSDPPPSGCVVRNFLGFTDVNIWVTR